jgi:hypothetical protein
LKLEKRDHLGDLGEGKGMILKRFIKVFTVRIYTGLNWLETCPVESLN